ncbi:hypothetical protein HT031_001074 [Scenedesmus sp. PABB004]|nr:hypothetical protein HT031_001074 [Scenedesmus sp. PABB004]
MAVRWEAVEPARLEAVECAEPDAAAGLLAEALGLPEFRHDARSAITLDYAASVQAACRELQLGARATAAVLWLAQRLLESCAGGASRQAVQEQLRAGLLALCGAAPAPALPADAVHGLAGAFARGLLQHYAAYALAMTREQAHMHRAHDLLVESAVAPPPLEAALAEADWQARIAAEAAAREAARVAGEAAEAEATEAAAAAARADAAAAEAAARAEQLQRKPQSLGEAVDKLVALRLEEVRGALSADYAQRAAALAARVGQLEAAAATAAAAQLAPATAAAAKAPRAGSAARAAPG